MKYSISPQQFNAVSACAAKGDVRYYLNGFFIDYNSQCIVATNGRVMAKAPLTVVDPNGAVPHKHVKNDGWLFQGLGKAISNKGGDTVLIDTDARTLTYVVKGTDMTVGLAAIDDTFPDYGSAEAQPEARTPVEEIGLNPELIAKPMRWAGAEGAAHIRFSKDRKGMYVTFTSAELRDVEVTLMPYRI